MNECNNCLEVGPVVPVEDVPVLVHLDELVKRAVVPQAVRGHQTLVVEPEKKNSEIL